jgi:UTP--glucose-1-phosphate uridylyltransferase
MLATMSLTLDDETRKALALYGFDEAQLARFAERARDTSADDNAVRGVVTPPAEGDVQPLPAVGSAERARLRAIGRDAIRRGEVGVVILAGGMATRFGGVVKAVVPVFEGRSFLEIKVDDVVACAAHAGGSVPIFVMTSFATHERIVEHVRDKALDPAGGPAIACFPQFVSLRLTPDGALFRDTDGTLSPYATGHGDLTFGLRRSGLLARFRAAGGKLLYMSNVDNLGATLEPAIIGLHIERGAAITAEVVRKDKGDKGGAPARLDGVPQIIEAFRFPRTFDQDAISVFNTNTFVLDAAAIDRDFALPFYRVEKKVEGRTAIQFERLVGELTAFLPSAFVEVERDGLDGRFQPAKDPEELAHRLTNIIAIAKSERWK